MTRTAAAVNGARSISRALGAIDHARIGVEVPPAVHALTAAWGAAHATLSSVRANHPVGVTTAALTSLDASHDWPGSDEGLLADLDFADTNPTNAVTKRWLRGFLDRPLWPGAAPASMAELGSQLERDLRGLGAGFDVWTEWFHDRLIGKPASVSLEQQWAYVTPELLDLEPRAINEHLRQLRDGVAKRLLRRARVIVVGHGGAGKTSLIRALHGEEVQPNQEMTEGIEIGTSTVEFDFGHVERDEEAGVFTRVSEDKDLDLTVHFWDFGGQVMAHATHTFFLRGHCLYVIVLEPRAERDANEEAEYWLEHVRAFGDKSPTMVIGNKFDVRPVELRQQHLHQKYDNIVGFYPLACTHAVRGELKPFFDDFQESFREALEDVGSLSQVFTDAQYHVLKSLQRQAARIDLMSPEDFASICASAGIVGTAAREEVLELFDRLGLVMRFEKLPLYVLNPSWLTLGVYSILYSEKARLERGKLSDQDIFHILCGPHRTEGFRRRYADGGWRFIRDAMVQFELAYVLPGAYQGAQEKLVIPQLLRVDEPHHSFDRSTAIAFRFKFDSLLPRHLLPSLVVQHHTDIVEEPANNQIVWQDGVLLRDRTGSFDAASLVTADYTAKHLDLHVTGPDTPHYLMLLRRTLLGVLERMPDLRYNERIRLDRHMRIGGSPTLAQQEVWHSYRALLAAIRNGMSTLPGEDGEMYDVSKIMAAVPAFERVFISYGSEDIDLVRGLAEQLSAHGISTWYSDRDLGSAARFRQAIVARIDAAEAVLVVWTPSSVDSDWVCFEADLGSKRGKLMQVRMSSLPPDAIPAPFAANHHIPSIDDVAGVVEGLKSLGVHART